MSKMDSWTDEVISQWQIERIELNTSITNDQINVAEQILNFTFPDQFKQLYTKANGFSNYDWLSNMFSIWPLERIIDEYQSSTNKQFIAFADFLIGSHWIGFMNDRDGIYKFYKEPEFVSVTFEQAIRLINSDATIIYV
ncbi:SMI1 / KNR4 family (SUKH-1) [Dyadobacter sp. SG02]|nr:SMI1 / KNR4 family (SUKH-1) [Dyadobacter sp. SG02]